MDPFEFLPDVDGEIERVNGFDTPAEDRGFRLEICGDYLHKNDCSGGLATFIPLPNNEADARVVEDDGVWFMNRVAGTTSYSDELIRTLSTGLLEI